MPKRRANGEGSIRKRKDGQWEGRYTVGHDPETGKAIIKNVLGKTQAEVKEKLKKAIEENVDIDYGRAKTYTVGSWLEVWMENYAKIKLRPSTYKTSQGFLKNHIKPQIGSIPLADLTSLDLQRFYKHLLDGGRVDRIEAKKKPKGLVPKTVRNIHQMIGSAYNLAIEQKLVTRNPAQGCALPKVEHKEMKTLTADQLSAFFQEAKDSGVYELYYLDLATGLRRGELLGLKWTDIDLDHGVLKIQRAISRQNGKVVEALTVIDWYNEDDFASYEVRPATVDMPGYELDGWYQTLKDAGNVNKRFGSLYMAKKYELVGKLNCCINVTVEVNGETVNEQKFTGAKGGTPDYRSLYSDIVISAAADGSLVEYATYIDGERSTGTLPVFGTNANVRIVITTASIG